jgi:hypothetical protein
LGWKDDGDSLAEESSISVIGHSAEGLECPANNDPELERARRLILLDGLGVDLVRFRENLFVELLELLDLALWARERQQVSSCTLFQERIELNEHEP